MVIQVRVAVSGGWLTFTGHAPEGSDLVCKSLPGSVSRAQYWSMYLGQKIPDGRGLIWTIVAQ